MACGPSLLLPAPEHPLQTWVILEQTVGTPTCGDRHRARDRQPPGGTAWAQGVGGKLRGLHFPIPAKGRGLHAPQHLCKQMGEVRNLNKEKLGTKRRKPLQPHLLVHLAPESHHQKEGGTAWGGYRAPQAQGSACHSCPGWKETGDRWLSSESVPKAWDFALSSTTSRNLTAIIVFLALKQT